MTRTWLAVVVASVLIVGLVGAALVTIVWLLRPGG